MKKRLSICLIICIVLLALTSCSFIEPEDTPLRVDYNGKTFTSISKDGFDYKSRWEVLSNDYEAKEAYLSDNHTSPIEIFAFNDENLKMFIITKDKAGGFLLCDESYTMPELTTDSIEYFYLEQGAGRKVKINDKKGINAFLNNVADRKIYAKITDKNAKDALKAEDCESEYFVGIKFKEINAIEEIGTLNLTKSGELYYYDLESDNNIKLNTEFKDYILKLS